MSDFNNKDFWRAIILYGLNTATYKMALGQSLINFINANKTIVTIHELAEDFFEQYRERLKNGMPQLNLPNRLTVMERVIKNYDLGRISRAEAIDKVAKEAFNDVIPRFHKLDDKPIPIKFYEFNDNKLTITDNVFEIFSDNKNDVLKSELSSRWALLEAAFLMKKENNELINDIRNFYLQKGYERTDITGTRPVLNGYQEGVCFYCGEIMLEDDIHVDHVIPRQLLNHDDIWNLVLAHDFCNVQKSDALPNRSYIEKLIQRNEYFIVSNHPIKNKLLQQLGFSPKERRGYVLKAYEDATVVIRCTWDGIRGYNCHWAGKTGQRSAVQKRPVMHYIA